MVCFGDNMRIIIGNDSRSITIAIKSAIHSRCNSCFTQEELQTEIILNHTSWLFDKCLVTSLYYLYLKQDRIKHIPVVAVVVLES